MRYVCLTCDFDGTIARDGKVMPSTLEELGRVRSSSRKLILATGRQLDDLFAVFPEVTLFDRVVAENGGVLYRPSSKERIVLGDPPPRRFVEELARRGVEPVSEGQCVVATWHPHETTILQVIREMSLELQIIFNKNAVMVLPSGINKGTGVRRALSELGLSAHNTVGMGDAENDHEFFKVCECGVAVANALPALKERADYVTAQSHGAGVEEAIQLLLENDLQDLAPRLKRHDLELGCTENGEPFFLPAYHSRFLIAGPSGSGKSTTVSAIVERLMAVNYQVCLFDPEGDYDEFEKLLTLGGPDRIPTSTEVSDALGNPKQSVSVNLLGVPVADRPSFFQSLLAHVQETQLKKGRPHWVIIDEAHHVLPAELSAMPGGVPEHLSNFVLVTVHPDLVSPVVLKAVNGIIAVGRDPQIVLDHFNKGARTSYRLNDSKSAEDQTYTMVWLLAQQLGPSFVKVKPAEGERRRHQRKYAAGELGEDKSFYFRGADGKLNLRAQNMNIFAQLAEGVDEDTWSFHLAEGDYSRWLRDAIKDKELAETVARIENNASLSAKESRAQVIGAIRKNYTAPA